MRLLCAFRLEPKCTVNYFICCLNNKQKGRRKSSEWCRAASKEVAMQNPQLFTVMTQLTMSVIKLNVVLTRYNTVFKRLSAPALSRRFYLVYSPVIKQLLVFLV